MTENNGTGLTSGLNAGLDLTRLYASALSNKPNPKVQSPELGGGRIDVQAIQDQSFEKDPFAFGDILTGATSGAALGPVGAVVGGIAGLGSAVIKEARQSSAKNDFDTDRRRKIREGLSRNMLISRRDRVMRNLGQESADNISKFYN